MANLLQANKERTTSKFRFLSILIIPMILLIIDQFYVTRDGEFILIADLALTMGDILLLFLLALALMALMRPMDHKKFHHRNN